MDEAEAVEIATAELVREGFAIGGPITATFAPLLVSVALPSGAAAFESVSPVTSWVVSIVEPDRRRAGVVIIDANLRSVLAVSVVELATDSGDPG